MMDNSFNSRNTVAKKDDCGRRKSCVFISILGIVSLVTSFFPQSRGQSGAPNTGEGRDRWRLYKPKLKPSVIIIFKIVFVSSEICSFSQSRGQTGAGNRNRGRGDFESDLFDAATYYLSEEICSDEKRDRSLLVLVIGSALALVIGSLQVSISISLFQMTAVLICIWTDSLQVRVSILQFVALVVIGLQARVKKHGHRHDRGQSSSGPAGGSGAGNAGRSRGGGGKNGRINHGIGEGRRGGSGQRQGNGDDDDNNGRDVIGNVENGRNPRPEERAIIFLPIITGSIAYMLSLNDAELSTTARIIRHFSMIINLVGFICCAVVLWQPYTNPRVARHMSPRVATILSRIGSALAVLGFISTIAIDLPIYLSWICGLVFLALLAIFLVDMLA